MYVVVVVQKYNSTDINDRQILNALRCNFNASAAHEIEILAEPPCTIPAAPVINSTGGTQLCSSGTGSPSSINLNTTSAAPTGFYYQWRRNGTNISGATGENYTATQAGTYTAYLISSTLPACVSAFSNSIVTILTVLPSPTLSCTTATPNSIVFGWNSISGATGYMVSINGGALQPSNGLLSHTLSGLTAGTTATCAVMAIGAYTCQNSIASSTISCSASPCASVTPVINGLPATACSNGTVIPISGTPSGGIFTGPGIVGNTFNPNLAGAGTHTLTYTYSLSAACVYTATKTITVTTPLSSPSFSYYTSELEANFTSAPLSATYTWNFGDGNTGTGQSATHNYSTAGTYNVCLTVSILRVILAKAT